MASGILVCSGGLTDVLADSPPTKQVKLSSRERKKESNERIERKDIDFYHETYGAVVHSDNSLHSCDGACHGSKLDGAAEQEQ